MKCKTCGKELIKWQKLFCSNSCSATFNNKGIRRHGKTKPNSICLNCGKETNGSRYKYCSNQCQADLRWKKWCEVVEKHQEFKGFKAYHSGGSVSRIKKYYIKKFGHQCMICNRTEWEGKPIPLILDHINGKSDNWKISNLRIVCPNCDAQLPTYGGANRGNGKRIHKVTVV